MLSTLVYARPRMMPLPPPPVVPQVGGVETRATCELDTRRLPSRVMAGSGRRAPRWVSSLAAGTSTTTTQERPSVRPPPALTTHALRPRRHELTKA